MNYFDSDMSKSTNTVVYFDWKTVIYIYVCRQCRTQFMLPNSSTTHLCRESQSHELAHVLKDLYPLINCSFDYKAKKGRHVRISDIHSKTKIEEKKRNK